MPALTPPSTTLLALVPLVALVLLGTALGRRIGSHRWGIPEALLAGSLGLLLAPDGPLPLLPPAVIRVWDQLPLPLLTLVFACLLLGKPLPRLGALWRPVGAQLFLALTLAFGQFLMAGLLVLLVLGPWLGVHPLMACLIEVAYEGGHGSAAAMGPTYAELGFSSGQALGLAMATVGLLASTLVGGLVVVLGRRWGWPTAWPELPDAASGSGAEERTASAARTGSEEMTASEEMSASAAVSGAVPVQAQAQGRAQPKPAGSAIQQLPPVAAALASAQAWGRNLALSGVAVLLGWLAQRGLLALVAGQDNLLAVVVQALPVFPLALLASLLVRLLLERCGLQGWASAAIQGRLGAVAADLLITAATACLDLSLLRQDWLPLSLLALTGLGWNLAVVLLLGPRLLPPDWFERAIVEFGQATGVAASGLLLLRMADPQDRSDALSAFSIKQLLLQPLIAGGVITVVAPLAISGWGLPAWTGLCLALVLLWISLGVLLARHSPQS